MKYGLTSARSIVEDRPIATQKVALACDLRSHQLQLANHCLVLAFCVIQRSKMLSRAQQNVRRRLRADVFERKNLGILVHDLGRNLLRGDLAEQAVSAHQFPPAGADSSSRTTIGVTPSRWRSCSPNCRAASSPETLPTRTR